MAKTTIIYASKDTFVSSTSSCWDSNFGRDSNLVFDTTSKCLLYFDLSSIPPNATITSAKLHLYLYSYCDTISPISITIKQLESDFYENIVTASTAPSAKDLLSDDTKTQNIKSEDINKFITFDNLTNTLSEWYSNSSTNHGFELSISSNNTNSSLSFFSKESTQDNLCPNLEVEYTVSTSTINPIETNIISEMIYQYDTFVESSIYNISNTIFFNFFIDNSLIGSNGMSPQFVYVDVKSSSTINGNFQNIGNLISIAPGTNKSIEVSSVNNYIYLSIRGVLGTRISVSAIFKNFFTSKTSSISSCKIVDDDLIFTMTRPPANKTPNITDFTITPSKDFDYLPEIKIIKTIVSGTTAIITCSDNAIFFFGTTLTYTATEKGDLTGINGDVLDFTNQPLLLDTQIVIAPSEKITIPTYSIDHAYSTIYFIPEEMTFKYSLNLELKSHSRVNIGTQGYDRTSNKFVDIPNFLPATVSNITVIPITISPKYSRVRLSVNKIRLDTDSPDEIDILEITPIYTAPYNYMPPRPLSGKVINKGNEILLTMSKPLIPIVKTDIYSDNIFTICTYLGENIPFTFLTVLDTSVTLSLKRPLKLASTSADCIYISYIFKGIYSLESLDSYTTVNDFIDFKIEPYMDNVNVTKKITPLAIDTKTTIEDISEFVYLKYIVHNTSSNTLLAKLQSSATRLGTFATIDDEVLILPSSFLEIPVCSAEKYVRLSVRKYEDTAIDTAIDITTCYTNYTSNIPSIPDKGSVADNGSKIIFTMTKPLTNVLGADIPIGIFKITTSLNTSITVSKLTVIDATVTLILKESIKTPITDADYIKLSYISTDDINYLTGKNGNVQDFADFEINPCIEIVTIEEFFSLSTNSTKTTIYDTSRSLIFNYIINTTQCLSDTVVSPTQCDSRNGQFESIPNMSVTIPANSRKTITLLPTKVYVSLSLNHEVASDKFIYVNAQYTCFSDMVPSKVISGKVIEKGSQMVLTMSKQLNRLSVPNPVPGIFNITTSLGKPVIISNLLVSDTTVTLTLKEAITTSEFLYLDYTATDATNYLTDKNGNIDNFAHCKIDIYVEIVEINQTIVPKTSYIDTTIYDARKAVTFKYIVNNTSSINTVYVMLNKSISRTGSFESALELELSIGPNNTLEIPVLETNFYICLSVRTDSTAIDAKPIFITAHYEASPHKIPAMPMCGYCARYQEDYIDGDIIILLRLTKYLHSTIDSYKVGSTFDITDLEQLITFKAILVSFVNNNNTNCLELFMPNLTYSSDAEFLITYKGDDVNKITGQTGDLDNFTDFKIYCNKDSKKCKNL